MNWNDPEHRLALIERVGVAEYNRQFDRHRAASTVAVVNRHAIRPLGSHFGTIYMIDTLGVAFPTLEAAKQHAAKHENIFDALM
jgi:hypothetical protein